MGKILFAQISHHEDGEYLVPHVACHMDTEEEVDLDVIVHTCDVVDLRFAIDPAAPGAILMTLMCRARMGDGTRPRDDASFDLVGFSGHTNVKTPDIFRELRNECGHWRFFLRCNYGKEVIIFDVLPNGKVKDRVPVLFEVVEHAFKRVTLQ